MRSHAARGALLLALLATAARAEHRSADPESESDARAAPGLASGTFAGRAAAGGALAGDGTGAQVLSFQVVMPKGFEWGAGGVLPGLEAGPANCTLAGAAAGDCWSVRLAWGPGGSGLLVGALPAAGQARPLAPWPPGAGGAPAALALEPTGEFKWRRNAWQVVRLAVQANEPGKADGVVEARVGGAVVFRRADLVLRAGPGLGVDRAPVSAAYAPAVGGADEPKRPAKLIAFRKQRLVVVRRQAVGASPAPQEEAPKASPPAESSPPAASPPPPAESPAPLTDEQSADDESPAPAAPAAPAAPPPDPTPTPPPAPVAPAPAGWMSLSADQRRRAQALTSIFENASIEPAYGYCEDNRDGRGFTFGHVGFTTRYSDGLAVLQALAWRAPASPLAAFIPALQQVLAKRSGSVATLGGFCEAVAAAAAADGAFAAAQEDAAEVIYWRPARRWAASVGAALPITLGQLYDALINHGEGADDDFSVDGIFASAASAASGTPASGVDEQAWLRAFLAEREKVLQAAGGASYARRIDFYRRLLDAGDLQLEGPIYVDKTARADGWTITNTYHGRFTIP
jgi:chitosanase